MQNNKSIYINIDKLIDSISAIQIFKEESVCIYQIKNQVYPYQRYVELSLNDLDHAEVFIEKYFEIMKIKPKLSTMIGKNLNILH